MFGVCVYSLVLVTNQTHTHTQAQAHPHSHTHHELRFVHIRCIALRCGAAYCRFCRNLPQHGARLARRVRGKNRVRAEIYTLINCIGIPEVRTVQLDVFKYSL